MNEGIGMMQHLVVVRPFGPWRVGDVVREAAAMDEVVGSEFRDHVVRVVVGEG